MNAVSTEVAWVQSPRGTGKYFHFSPGCLGELDGNPFLLKGTKEEALARGADDCPDCLRRQRTQH